jgi:hypothetical protein
MRRLVITVVTLLLLIASRTADLATTLYFNPSLDREGNPIVLLLPGGVTSLVSVSALVLVIFSIALFAFWRGQSLALSSRPADLAAFLSIWLQNVAFQRRPFGTYLPTAPHWNEGLQAVRLFGVALAWAIIFGSFAAVHAWFATRELTTVTAYQRIYSALRVGHFNYLPFMMAAIGSIFGAFVFFWSDYAEMTRRQVDV